MSKQMNLSFCDCGKDHTIYDIWFNNCNWAFTCLINSVIGFKKRYGDNFFILEMKDYGDKYLQIYKLNKDTSYEFMCKLNMVQVITKSEFEKILDNFVNNIHLM